MVAMPEHTIPFIGLKDGLHDFRFELGEAFFTAAADEEMQGGQVVADVQLDKSPTMLVADIRMTGALNVVCDHCNAPMEWPVACTHRQVFHLNGRQRFDEADDDVVGLEPDDHAINLSHHLYECLRLALPIRHVHAEGACDPEVEAALERMRHDKTPSTDPRWEALQRLKAKR